MSVSYILMSDSLEFLDLDPYAVGWELRVTKNPRWYKRENQAAFSFDTVLQLTSTEVALLTIYIQLTIVTMLIITWIRSVLYYYFIHRCIQHWTDIIMFDRDDIVIIIAAIGIIYIILYYNNIPCRPAICGNFINSNDFV